MIRRLPARSYIVLEAAGRLADELGMSVFVVGGIVRDLLRGGGTFDLDLVVEGDGIAFARALAHETSGKVTTHARFRTATVTLDESVKVDIATARKESYEQPAALPLVLPASIQDDLLRRDFTINALAVRINARRFGEVVDMCVGQGDVSAKRIRVLHDRSFLDDPTRIFRAIRFEQRLGFRMDRTTLALLNEAVAKGMIAHLSGHWLRDELRLLLSEPHPRRVVARMAQLGVLRTIHPKLAWSKKLDGTLKEVENAVAWYARSLSKQKLDSWVVRMMAMLEGLSPKAVQEIAKRLALPVRQVDKIRTAHAAANVTLRRLAKRPPPKPSDTYHALDGLADETLLFLMAKAKPDSVKRQVSAHLTAYQRTRPSLTGADLKSLGLKPGPLFRKILDRLLDARLDGDVKSEADEREVVKKFVRA